VRAGAPQRQNGPRELFFLGKGSGGYTCYIHLYRGAEGWKVVAVHRRTRPQTPRRNILVRTGAWGNR
jgi:hypothetical protein